MLNSEKRWIVISIHQQTFLCKCYGHSENMDRLFKLSTNVYVNVTFREDG
jgi:hypothetical protein